MADKSGLFATGPFLGMTTISGANTSRDGSGSNLYTAYTTNSDVIIDGVLLNNSNLTGSTWQNRVIRIFIEDSDVNYLYLEVIPKYLETPSDTSRTKPQWINLNKLPLESGQSIVVSQSLFTANADLVSVAVYGEKI